MVRISGEKNGRESRMQIISAALNATKILSQDGGQKSVRSQVTLSDITL